MSLRQGFKSKMTLKQKTNKQFALLVGVSLLALILLVGGVYRVYLYQRIQIKPLKSSVRAFEGDDYISWMFIKVDKVDLTQTKVEEICFLFLSHHTYEIQQICFKGDAYLEDKTEFAAEGYVKLADIFIDTHISSNGEILPSVIQRLEEIGAINIDMIVVLPTETTDQLFADIGIENADLSLTIRDLFDIDYLMFLSNYSIIEKLVDQSFYGNFDKANYLSLAKYLREYKFVEEDVNKVSKKVRNESVNKYITYKAWDEFFEDFHFYEDIQFEQAQVEILNASNKAGYAAYMKRWFEHLGIRVIRVDNAPGEVNKSCEGTKVYIPAGVYKYPKTTEVVKAVAARDIGTDSVVYFERPTFVSTGDIVVLLCGVKEDN